MIKTKTKTILWLSRHKPLPAQIDYLKQKIGDFKLIQYDMPIATAQRAVELAKECNADYIVPVLPLSFIMHLVSEAKKEGFVVLRAEMELLHNCPTDPCGEFRRETDVILKSTDFDTGRTIHRHFRFREFVKLVDIKIVTQPL